MHVHAGNTGFASKSNFKELTQLSTSTCSWHVSSLKSASACVAVRIHMIVTIHSINVTLNNTDNVCTPQ